jgi:hypothetical protein
MESRRPALRNLAGTAPGFLGLIGNSSYITGFCGRASHGMLVGRTNSCLTIQKRRHAHLVGVPDLLGAKPTREENSARRVAGRC